MGTCVCYQRLCITVDRDYYKIILFELLGPSLEDLIVYCSRRVSLKTALMVMDQLLTGFEALHSRGFLHRDIKPQNCLLGTENNGNTVYLTDFGLAREYTTNVEERAEDPARRCQLVGTARYASIREHLGQRMYPYLIVVIGILTSTLAQSPRDDLESLGYMMVYFLKGRLPWQGKRRKEKPPGHGEEGGCR